MDIKSKSCRTVLLTDAPAQADSFGSHENIANAIVELIRVEDGGKTIGLEGGWGSGKSTVVNLVTQKLVESPDDLVIVFDTWAHQGDPLRRTFLETLISTIQSSRQTWVEKEVWDNKRDELAKRRQVEKKRSYPILKTWGKWLVILTLLVPFGLALLTAGLNKGVSISKGGLFNWQFLIGSIITLAPFLLYGISELIRLSRKNHIEKTDEDLFTLVFQKTVTDTITETISTPDPTSLEFESLFAELMRKTLSGVERRLVIVFDNLDRIDAKDALSILSTLQTFIEHKAECDRDWLKKVWVIIPYDELSLQKLWPSDSPKNGSTKNGSTALSFLDKRFQIRFEVPPLVLSNWSNYLLDLLKVALPDHKESEFYLINRVYALYRKDKDKSPTPRDLKLYINQIGALHRQWQDIIPIQHMGYYVVLKRKGVAIDKALIEGKLIDQDVESLLGTDISDNLAAMYFNVEVPLAKQLLLKEPIINALGEGNTDELTNLSKLRGFEQVLVDVPFHEWIDAESHRLAKAASALTKSDILQNINSSVAKIIKQALKRAAISTSYWNNFTPDIGLGIASLFYLLGYDREVLKKSIKAISSKMIPGDNETPTPDSFNAWIDGLVVLFQEIDGKDSINIDEFRGQIRIPANEKGYIKVCTQLSKRDTEGKYWSLIVPKVDSELIATELGEIAKTDTLSRDQLLAIRVMKAGHEKINWGPIITEIGNRLKINTTYSPHLVSTPLSILWELIQDEGRSKELLQELAQGGFIFHHLNSVKSDPEAAAWCLVSHAYFSPNFSVASQFGGSVSGRMFIDELFAQPEQYEELTEQVVRLLSSLNQQSLLYKILDGSPNSNKWVGSALASVIKNDYKQFFPINEFITRWNYFCEELDENEYNFLISNLIKSSDLVNTVVGNKFNIDDVCLYVAMIENGGDRNKEFTNWCINYLQQVNTDEWILNFEQRSDLLDLVASLVDHGVAFKLESFYQDALEDYTNSLLENKQSVEYSTDFWHSLLKPLPDERRKNLFSRIINKVIKLDGEIQDQFFELYGPEIIDKKTLSEEAVVLNIFLPLLKKRKIMGLEWLASVITKYPSIFKNKKRTGIKEFRDRVVESLDVEDGALIHIKRIAQTLGIDSNNVDRVNSTSPD